MTVRIEELLCVVTVTAELAVPLVRAREAGACSDDGTSTRSSGVGAAASAGASLARMLDDASSANRSEHQASDPAVAPGGRAAEEASPHEVADRVYRLMRRELELARERE